MPDPRSRTCRACSATDDAVVAVASGRRRGGGGARRRPAALRRRASHELAGIRPVLVAVPTVAEAERLAGDLVAVARPRRRRAVPRLGDAAVRAGVAGARDDGPAPPGDVAPAGGRRRGAGGGGRAGAGAGAAARPARRGQSSRSSARRATRSTATSWSSRLVGGLPARVPGGGAGRGRGARLDRRRLPRRPTTTRCASTSGATRSTGSRRSRSPTSAAPTTSTTSMVFPCRELLPDRRGPRPRRGAARRARRGAASSGSGSPRARCSTAWSRGCRGSPSDEHLLPDLLPAGARVLLVEPRRMRDRAQELLDEEAALARRRSRSRGAREGDEFPRLSLPFDRLLAHTHRPATTSVLAAPDDPDTPAARRDARSIPVVGDVEALARRASARCVRGGAPRRPRGRGRRARRADSPTCSRAKGSTRSSARRSSRARRDRRRAARARRRPARRATSRSSPRPTSPAAGACTATARGARKAVDYYDDLKPGDFVVHQVHGVGRYEGMVARAIGGVERDYLLARVPGRRQALRPDRPGRHRAPVHGRRLAVASADGRRRVAEDAQQGAQPRSRRSRPSS